MGPASYDSAVDSFAQPSTMIGTKRLILEASATHSYMAKNKTDRNCTHLAGEFFVAAELYRRGYSVAMTLGNAKAIDLFAEREARTVNVQVKAIRDKKSVNWTITKRKIKDNIIYIFVCLNPAGTPPDYYVCTSQEARIMAKQFATRGIVNLNALKNDKYRDRWDKIESALPRR